MRQAIRLVRAELKDILSSLETRDEGAEDKFGAIAATFSLIPAPEETEWHRRREKIALLVDDEHEDAWEQIAVFHILLGQFVRFLEPGPDGAAESAVESVASDFPALIAVGKNADHQLGSLL